MGIKDIVLAGMAPVADPSMFVPPRAAPTIDTTAMRVPGRSKTFGELYVQPAFIDNLAGQGIDPGAMVERAQTRAALTAAGMDATQAATVVSNAARRGIPMQDLISALSAAPQRWGNALAGAPNPPNPDAPATWQHCGPAVAGTVVGAGASVTVTFQPAKPFLARVLTIVAGANATADQDDLVVSNITIGGVTYSNSGFVPSTLYRPTSNTIAGNPNFAGPYVQANTTISLTLTNNGADPLTASVAMGGPTG